MFTLRNRHDFAVETLQEQGRLLLLGADLVFPEPQPGPLAGTAKRPKFVPLLERTWAVVGKLRSYLVSRLVTPLDHEDMLRIGLQMSSILKTMSVVAEMMDEQASPPWGARLWAELHRVQAYLPNLIDGVLQRKADDGEFEAFHQDCAECKHTLAEARARNYGSGADPLIVLRRLDLYRVIDRLLTETRSLGRELQRVNLKNG